MKKDRSTSNNVTKESADCEKLNPVEVLGSAIKTFRDELERQRKDIKELENLRSKFALIAAKTEVEFTYIECVHLNTGSFQLIEQQEETIRDLRNDLKNALSKKYDISSINYN